MTIVHRRAIALIGLAAAVSLAGCSVLEWHKPGATQTDFQRDLAQCDILAAPQDNMQQPVRLLGGLGHGLTDAEKYCLRDRGWAP